MSAPRLEVDVDKIYSNARSLVGSLDAHNVAVTGVTKAVLGCPAIANALLKAGVSSLGDSRIGNIQTLRDASVRASMRLIRCPMMSEARDVVRFADVSFNTEIDVIRCLSSAAKSMDTEHRIVLMVELGDLREGIMPEDLEHIAHEALLLPNIRLAGLGSNLACRNGVVPDDKNMSELSELANTIEARFGLAVEIVSGGNSGNLRWALSTSDTGRINDLRLGEAILLGCDPLDRRQIADLHVDAFTLVAEVIECKDKPSSPWGSTAQGAFGQVSANDDRGCVRQGILAIGRQDCDPFGLAGPAGIEIAGASSDHLFVYFGEDPLQVGSEVRFVPNYSALLRAMTSPFVAKAVAHGSIGPNTVS